MAMGFPEDEVQRALDYAYDNVEQAATYLMEGRVQCTDEVPSGKQTYGKWP